VAGATDLEARLQRIEDELAVRRLILSYGPAADAGMARFAAALWLEDGVYDWDADGEPHRGAAAVEATLQSSDHRQLMAEGVAHVAGPVLVEVNGDRATALNYSLTMRRELERFYLWRVSAVRWDLERSGASWRVRGRTNRLLDDTGGGLDLFGSALQERFPDGPA
jgi:SnoaL-like domain